MSSEAEMLKNFKSRALQITYSFDVFLLERLIYPTHPTPENAVLKHWALRQYAFFSNEKMIILSHDEYNLTPL